VSSARAVDFQHVDAPADEALKPHGLLPNDALKIVATGEKEDAQPANGDEVWLTNS
jgi:hypothetical protein